MLNEFFRQFKSGTDIRGVAVEGVEGQHINLTDEVVRKIPDLLVLLLAKHADNPPDARKFCVGRDSRVS